MGIVAKPMEDEELLSFEDFDRLSRVIQKHAILRIDLMLEQDVQKRLSVLQQHGLYGGFEEEYRELALKVNK